MRSVSFRFFIPAYLAVIIDSMGYGIVYPLMTELFAGEQGFHMASGLSLTLRHFYLSLSFLLYPLAAFFCTSLIKNISKIIGRKKMLLLCMAGFCISFFLMGVGVELFSIFVLLIGRALSGVMAGSQSVAQAAIIEASIPERRPKNMAILSFILSIGIVIGPFIGGIFSDPSLSSLFTLSTPFYFAAILALLNTLWILCFFPPTPRTDFEKFVWPKPIKVLIAGFQTKSLRVLAWSFLLMQIGFSLFYQLIQIFVSTFFDFQSWEIGVFNGYLGIAIALVVLIGVRTVAKYFELQRVAILSLVLTGFSLILPMIYPDQLFIWIGSFFAVGFNMFAYGSILSCFSRAVDRTNLDWAMGVFGSIIAFAWTVTGFSINLMQWTGVRWLIIIGGFFMFLAAILVSAYNSRKLC